MKLNIFFRLEKACVGNRQKLVSSYNTWFYSWEIQNLHDVKQNENPSYANWHSFAPEMVKTCKYSPIYKNGLLRAKYDFILWPYEKYNKFMYHSIHLFNLKRTKSIQNKIYRHSILPEWIDGPCNLFSEVRRHTWPLISKVRFLCWCPNFELQELWC